MRCPQHEGIVCRDPSVHSKHLNFYGSWTMNNGVDFSQRKGHKYCKAGRRQSEVLRRGGSNRKYKYKYKNTKKYKIQIQKGKETTGEEGEVTTGNSDRSIVGASLPSCPPSLPSCRNNFSFWILTMSMMLCIVTWKQASLWSSYVRNTSFAIFWPRICFVWFFWSWSQKCILRGSYV